jgi:hypothetical protein
MKKTIIFLLASIILASPLGHAKSLDKEVAPSQFPDFKIIVDKDYSFEDLDKKYTIIEHTKEEGLVFYRLEKKQTAKSVAYLPVLDKNNNPVKLSPKDPDYCYEVTKALNVSIAAVHLETESDIQAVSVVFYNYGDYEPYKVLTQSSFSKHGIGSLGFVGFEYMHKYKMLSKGSAYIIDTNLNIEYLKLEDKEYKITQETLNPDLEESKLIYGMDDVITYTYSGYDNVGTGYIHLQLDNPIYTIAGKPIKYYPPPTLKDGQLMVGLEIVNKMGAFYERIRDTKEYRIVKADKPVWGPITVTDITITMGEKKAIVDGQEYELSAIPYYYTVKPYNDDPMIPLRDLCYLLNNELHWRPIDNSALIDKFKPIYPREPLPKK